MTWRRSRHLTAPDPPSWEYIFSSNYDFSYITTEYRYKWFRTSPAFHWTTKRHYITKSEVLIGIFFLIYEVFSVINPDFSFKRRIEGGDNWLGTVNSKSLTAERVHKTGFQILFFRGMGGILKWSRYI